MVIEEFVDILVSLKSDLYSKVFDNTAFEGAVDVKEFCDKLLDCLCTEDYHTHIDFTPIVIELSPVAYDSEDNIYQSQSFVNYLKSGISKRNNLLKLDIRGNIGLNNITNFLLERESEILEYSQNNTHSTYFFISGYALYVFQSGLCFYMCENINSTKPRAKVEKRLPIRNYETLIERHNREYLEGESQTVYWQNKKEFKLKRAPEMIFQKSLASFLQHNITDGFVIEECLNKNTTNRTDITIFAMTKFGMKSYILEIKWIGKSESTNFDGKKAHEKSNEGIKQLDIYLKKESEAICGHLVVYDARKIKIDIKWEKVEEWDARINRNPSLVALSNESASTRAKKK